jgi:integrase/recombinase XerD
MGEVERWLCPETESAILFQERSMRAQFHDGPSLFGPAGSRKYLNAAERSRFLESTQRLPRRERLFCQVLAWSGARISEVLALAAAAIDIESGVASIETLKRRRRGVIRQVPLPSGLLDELDAEYSLRSAQRDPVFANRQIWLFSRTTAWRLVKQVMAAAGISGTPAMPKGLRHGFGVNALQLNVPPHLVQRWLGHGSLRTTAIYSDVVGPEERDIAARMWTGELSLGTPSCAFKCKIRPSFETSTHDHQESP